MEMGPSLLPNTRRPYASNSMRSIRIGMGRISPAEAADFGKASRGPEGDAARAGGAGQESPVGSRRGGMRRPRRAVRHEKQCWSARHKGKALSNAWIGTQDQVTYVTTVEIVPGKRAALSGVGERSGDDLGHCRRDRARWPGNLPMRKLPSTTASKPQKPLVGIMGVARERITSPHIQDVSCRQRNRP